MNTTLNSKLKNEITIPVWGVDWRFLLPIDASSKMLLIQEDEADYDRSFRELNISFTIMGGRWPVDKLVKAPGSFDIIAAPLGTMESSVSFETIKLLHDSLCPQGTVLIGFVNRRSVWHVNRPGITNSSIYEMSSILQRTGFETIRFYGAAPDPISPGYIFSLNARNLSFILRHYFIHRLPKYILAFLYPPFTIALKNLLPFYYVTAKVQG